MPIHIYGKVRLFMLNGKVEIKAPIKTGMITIGSNVDSFALFDHSGFISLGSRDSKIVFEGDAQISVNCKIRVPFGTLTFGKNVAVCSGTRIICNGSYITIGDYTRIAFNSVVINSGFHYIYNINEKTIKRPTGPIIIGAHNWIANRSTISTGAKTMPYTIICSGSLVNKDFTKITEENVMLAGSPAKVIKAGVKRIFNLNLEDELIRWFDNNPTENTLHVSQDEFENNILKR